MKKIFKRTCRMGKIHILRWTVDGKLFGPEWDTIAQFDDNGPNSERCTRIVRLLNECDRHTNNPDNDRKRDP